MRQVVLTASANTGMGLWTMICVGFSHIFGVESKNLKAKQEKVLNMAKTRLSEQFSELGPGYELSDFRVTNETSLTITVSALATKSEDYSVQKCPKCGSEIDDEMIFCAVCGQKLK